MTMFLQRAHKKVKGLAEKETWKIEEFTDYGAITNLVSLLISLNWASLHRLLSPVGSAKYLISPLTPAINNNNNILTQLSDLKLGKAFIFIFLVRKFPAGATNYDGLEPTKNRYIYIYIYTDIYTEKSIYGNRKC